MASHPVYQFHVELADFEPVIWRRFQVMGNITMARLGYILMTMFEMQASHLFSFEFDVDKNSKIRTPKMKVKTKKILEYKIPQENDAELEDFFPNDRYIRRDATKEKLSRVISLPKVELLFNYDFGDDWWLVLKLEEIFIDKDLPGKELPRVLEGAGYGIVEDCGGTPGLEDLVTAFREKSGEDYETFSDWMGITEFDIEAFDIGDMNFRLKKVPRIYTDIYEHRSYPTQQSIDLLQRKYLL